MQAIYGGGFYVPYLASNKGFGISIKRTARVGTSTVRTRGPRATASSSRGQVEESKKGFPQPPNPQVPTVSEGIPSDGSKQPKDQPDPTPPRSSTAEEARTAAGMGARPIEGNADQLRPAGEAPMAVEPAVKTAETVYGVVFVTSEAAPYSKTGGLGDVCGSLPKALAKRGHRVMVVVPRYQDYEGVQFTGVTAKVDEVEFGYHHKAEDGVDFVFVDHPSYQRTGGLYGDKKGNYGDNQWRFKLLCQAALEAPLRLPLNDKGIYGQDCIFVANVHADWFAGLIPVYLAARYRPGGIYLGARTVLLIHNLAHQGVYSPGTFESLCLPGDWYRALEWQYPPDKRLGAYEEEGRAINTLKGAITTADRIVAVSPGFAYEIQTALGGRGMEFLLGSRQYALNGVLNGIDYKVWNPKIDPHIPAKYSSVDLEGKKACKAKLQEELGLPVNGDIPLIGFIGRLDSQKGADLILGAAKWVMEQGAQLVCLGTGDTTLEDGLRWLEGTYKQQARGWVGFDVPFSHRLTAGADILLMPSRFEPCGLNQMYAMKYGTVPVAHATGGLRDTVKTYNEHQQDGTTGFAFEPCTSDALKSAIWDALKLYRHDKERWKALMMRGMEQDFTWNHAAEQYEQIFAWAKADLPYCG